ncbi:PREDICTED: nuclear pore membrane glycoprotein 210-like [Priapulus caudatus]|uniref:Nuclear pore membrane glycoprotein 210-like n=1 Tax=Priapulus caudatus TaxID=37621 RepID=A0ABM1EUS1_PRICU|nr:PREDICTED: nuclear pore membrane glycoprotein 210-like [Priapulus caudatus]
MAVNRQVLLQKLVTLCVICYVAASKLNVPRVLLPYCISVSTNFTLEVTDGCYTWQSSRPDVATVTPIDPEPGTSCATKAIVSSVWKQPVRMTSIILGQETGTGQVLRCDVIVDKIHRLEIVTTTRELFLEDAPELFELRAFNDQDDTFSSLEGLAFQWNLISNTDSGQDNYVDANSVLRVLTFEESPYETPHYIDMLERQGLQGHMCLVEGIKTGSAKVTVKLRHPAYKAVNASTVALIVVANLMLNPAHDVYLLQHTSVAYRVELIKQGRAHEISMPSQQYYLELTDTSIGSLEVDTSTVTGLKYGNTEIVLKDRNINIKELIHHPTGHIYVVTPGYLGFVVLPGRVWVLQTDRVYDIMIEIYDRESHRIHPSDNLRVVATFSEKYFEVLYSSENGTYHRVHTRQTGTTSIHGLLDAVVATDGKEIKLKPPMKAAQEVEIFDPIVVTPPQLVFPWEPVNKGSYHYTLKASGGSGNFSWSSSDTGVARVNVKGEMVTLGAGRTTVLAADVRNPAHTGQGEVYVLPPTEMRFLPSVVEVEIGSVLHLPLAMSAEYTLDGEKRRVTFNDCSMVPFKVTIGLNTVFEQTKADKTAAKLAGSCVVIPVKGLQLGSTDVTVQYHYGTVKLEAVATVAAYKPLVPLDPEQVAVVAVGSSKQVVFEGGPQPWVLDPAGFYRHLKLEDDSFLSPSHTYGAYKTLHLSWVLCTGLGEQQLTVLVGNEATSTNPKPAKASASIRFACALPVSLHLLPLVAQPDLEIPPCPITPDSELPIPAHCDRNVDILAILKDNNGRRFDNFSSLAIEWEINDQTLASLYNTHGVQREEQDGPAWHRHARSLQTLRPKSLEGSVIVTARATHYNNNYFSSQKISHEVDIKPPISRSVELQLVEECFIEPDEISIFNHPSNKVALSIQKGSGYFHVEPRESRVAQVAVDNRVVSVAPAHDGALSLTAYDLCLFAADPARAQVQVSGVDSIDLRVVDKVELRDEVRASVRVLDSTGKPLSAQFFTLMNLKIESGSEIISVKPDPSTNKDPNRLNYIVRGVSLGHTTLRAHATLQNKQKISSQAKPIQVFPPLRLEPRNITLVLGALFQSGISLPDEGNFAMRLHARQQGMVTLRLRVVPDAHARYQLLDNRPLTDDVQIQVFEKLQVSRPNLCDGQMIITTDTEADLGTNRDGSADVTYQVISQSLERGKHGVISVDQPGRIVSGSSVGEASVLVTAREDFGINQTLVILVKVKEVSYLMLNTISLIHTSKHKLASVPIGMKLEFVVSFHDNIGEKFHTTNVDLHYRPSRFDLLQVSRGAQNGTLVARATRTGQTVLKVWDSNSPRKADYISVLVGRAIEPAYVALTLGEVVCFASPILSEEGHRGQWSAEGSVMSIDRHSGVAMATTVGTAQVTYSIGSSFVTQAEVSVAPVTEVKPLPHSHDFISNVPRKRGVVIPLLLSGDLTNERASNLLGGNCSHLTELPVTFPYRCDLYFTSHTPDITIHELFTAEPAFDPKLGRYQCVVMQKSSGEHVARAASALETGVELWAVVRAREGQAELRQTLGALPLRPAFHVSTAELHVSDLLPTAAFSISASDAVMDSITVVSSDSSIVEVLPPVQDAKAQHSSSFPLRLVESPMLWHLGGADVQVLVASLVTGQQEQVAVKVKLIGSKPGEGVCPPISHQVGWAWLIESIANNYFTWISSILITIITVAALYIGYRSLSAPRYYAAPMQHFSPRGTPVNGAGDGIYPTPGVYASPWAAHSASHGSPKSKLWSVGNEPLHTPAPYAADRSYNRRSPYQPGS